MADSNTSVDSSQDPSLSGSDIPFVKPVVTPAIIALPMGNDISDIYDPTLTPEQVNSLSPGDLNARNAALGTGPAVTNPIGSDGSIIVNGNNNTTNSTVVNSNNISSDWRVRLSLADGANYLYNSSSPGILKPLVNTTGVVFPYTPSISVVYSASYDPVQITHSNYKIQQYTGSSVDSVSITGEFTCQDVYEATYLLAVIQFFKSAVKMFYGQDTNPTAGTPPPLCFLHGLGAYQFSGHPLAIQNFTYSLPNDVDYITVPASALNSTSSTNSVSPNYLQTPSQRRLGSSIQQGGTSTGVSFNTNGSTIAQAGNTYVPTKIQLAISCVPVQSRNQLSNVFNLTDYASGKLNVSNSSSTNSGVFW